MSSHLNDLLTKQELTQQQIKNLQQLRYEIQNQLSVFPDNPRFYYGGSYAKKTMINTRYDLDIVIYWPHTTTKTIEEIYNIVGATLQKEWRYVNSKTVCWELPFEGGFHVDIVPGRALDNTFFEANLFRTDTKTTLKTSLKTHIDTVRYSGHAPVIKLMKLWREKRKVPFPKSFLLELMTIEGCKGIRTDNYHAQLIKAFQYINENIIHCQLKDPANSNNNLAGDLSMDSRKKIKAAANDALAAKSFNLIFE